MTMKRILRISISFVVLAAFFLLFTAVERARGERVCERLQIMVDNSKGVHFLNEKDIREFLKDREDSLVGRRLTSLSLHELEKELNRIPEVKDSEVFHELDGTLRVRVTQRRPIARFIEDDGESYYWDRRGDRMPLSDGYTARVPVVTGNAQDSVFVKGTESERGERFYKLLLRVHQDPFWSKQIQELHINPQGVIELLPLVGKQRVIFGDLKDYEKKLRKLKVFYREASVHTGLAQYDTLDLRYGDQVVGKK